MMLDHRKIAHIVDTVSRFNHIRRDDLVTRIIEEDKYLPNDTPNNKRRATKFNNPEGTWNTMISKAVQQGAIAFGAKISRTNSNGRKSSVATLHIPTLKARDICWLCGGKLIWGADFDPEDYGYEGDGIVATLTCSSCNADVTYIQIHRGEEE